MRNLYVLYFSGLLLTGCSQGPAPEKFMTATAGDVNVGLRFAGLAVGERAKVTATVQRGNTPLTQCQVNLRQFMVGMDMSDDHKLIPLTATGAEYVGQTLEISMGGDWSFELTAQCADKPVTVTFAKHIPWPQ